MICPRQLRFRELRVVSIAILLNIFLSFFKVGTSQMVTTVPVKLIAS